MSYTDNDYLLDNLSGEVKEYCDYLLDDEERFKKEVSSKEVGECNKVVFKHDCRCSKRESVLL